MRGSFTDEGVIYCDFERSDYCPIVSTSSSLFSCQDNWYDTAAADIGDLLVDVSLGTGSLSILLYWQICFQQRSCHFHLLFSPPRHTAGASVKYNSRIFHNDTVAYYLFWLLLRWPRGTNKFQFRAQNFRAKNFRAQNFRLNLFQSTKFQTEIISEHEISD